jgi:hypothetical protein
MTLVYPGGIAVMVKLEKFALKASATSMTIRVVYSRASLDFSDGPSCRVLFSLAGVRGCSWRA